jgi:hypothetical protein
LGTRRDKLQHTSQRLSINTFGVALRQRRSVEYYSGGRFIVSHTLGLHDVARTVGAIQFIFCEQVLWKQAEADPPLLSSRNRS